MLVVKNPALHLPKPFPFSMEDVALYLPLWQEDMQGSTFLSYDPAHRLCTVGAGTTWGITGRTLDGSDDYMSLGNVAALNVASDMTLEIWFQQNAAAAAGTIYSNVNGAIGVGLHVQIDAVGELVIRYNPIDGYYERKPASTAGTWYHLVVTYVAATTTLTTYLNLATGSTTTKYATVRAVATTEIGRRPDSPVGTYFKGITGEIRLYTRALSLAEVTHNYQVTKFRYQ